MWFAEKTKKATKHIAQKENIITIIIVKFFFKYPWEYQLLEEAFVW